MKWITPVLILIMIAVVVGISGCTDTGAGSQQTYSDGSIKFNYPEGFENTSLTNMISGDKSWMSVVALANNGSGTTIYVQKNPNFNNPEEARKISDTKTSGDVSTGEILAHTTETNPKGIEIFKSINTLKDPETGDTLKYIDFYFKNKKGIVYAISIFNTESEYQDVSDTANTIFNSLSLN